MASVHSRSFAEVWRDTVGVAGPSTAALAIVIALLIGGTDLLPVGLALAAVAGFVVTSSVTLIRMGRGAGGFPRRPPIQLGDEVGGWLVIDRLESDVRPEGTYLVRKGDEIGALKVTYYDAATDKDPQRRAEREGQYLDRVTSGHVARRLDSDATAIYSWLVTNYLGTQTAWHRRLRGAISDAELYSVAAGSLRGLVSLHREGIVHRDVTPRNVIVGDNGGAALIDLGIGLADPATRLTKTGVQMFTTGYAAPEQFGGVTDLRSDVFVWAATMYFLATGTEAFPGNAAEAQGKIMSRTPDLSKCPAWLRPVLASAFERDLEVRPSAEELLAQLEAANAGGWSIHVPRPATPDRARRLPSWSGGAAVTVALTVAMLTILLLVLDDPGSSPTAGPLEQSVVTAPASTLDAPSVEEPATTAAAESTELATTTLPATTTSSPTTSEPTTSQPTTTPQTAPSPGPAEAFLGVWSGDISRSSGGTLRLTLVFDQPLAEAVGAGIGRYGYGLCRGVLRIDSISGSNLAVAPQVTSDPERCPFDGVANLAFAEDSASYDWTSADGTDSTFGTLERSLLVDHEERIGWPTDKNEAPPAFFAWLGACVAGSSPPCSPTGGFPDWTACISDWCLVGLGDPEVFARDDYRYVLSLPDSPANAAIELMFVGFTDRQAVDLLT